MPLGDAAGETRGGEPALELEAVEGDARQQLARQDTATAGHAASAVLPDSVLYHQTIDAGSRYLVETDPRFASYRQWMSSDYLLAALGADPATAQKRLGDGFYEQRLLREQIGELTGRRFLAGYANDETQYLAPSELVVWIIGT